MSRTCAGRSTCYGRSGSVISASASRPPGGEVRRINLAAELQHAERGDALYVFDEPTTGLHPSDVAT
jgi:excinuclease ABC subunit A